MQKIVYIDGTITKAIEGKIIGEDSIFITLEANITKVIFRINKNYIVTIKDSQ